AAHLERARLVDHAHAWAERKEVLAVDDLARRRGAVERARIRAVARTRRLLELERAARHAEVEPDLARPADQEIPVRDARLRDVRMRDLGVVDGRREAGLLRDRRGD